MGIMNQDLNDFERAILENQKRLVLPPSDNMGALSTQDLDLEFEQLTLKDIEHATHNNMAVSFDWFEFTIKDIDFLTVIMELLDLDASEFTLLDSGGRGYKKSQLWTLGNVRVLYDGNEDMGVHVSMSGDGCRSYFAKKNPRLLIMRIKQFHGSFSRVDVAIDDIGARFFTVQNVIDRAKENEIVSKWRNFSIRQDFSISTLEKTNDTIYFGSMKSDICLRVYDKKLERKTKSIESLSEWVRWEVVYRDDKANALIDQLIMYDFNLGTVVVGVLSYYLRFTDCNPLDSNRSRWATSAIWSDFIGLVSSLRLSVIKAERSISTIKDWLTEQVMPSLCAVMRAENSLNWIVQSIFSNESRITDAVWDMIRLYKKSQGQAVLA